MAMSNNHEITNETKEACAIETMRCMLQRYALEQNIPFEDALVAFSASSTYGVLFDFETGVWREGPDYLRSLFDRSTTQAKN